MNTIADYHIVENKDELDSYYNIRREVFIEEQSCPENIEIDEHEDHAIHFIGLINGVKQPVPARLRFIGEKAKFERLAVLKKFRKYGLGRGMLEYVLAYIDKNNYQTTLIHCAELSTKILRRLRTLKEKVMNF